MPRAYNKILFQFAFQKERFIACAFMQGLCIHLSVQHLNLLEVGWTLWSKIGDVQATYNIYAYITSNTRT